MSLSLEQIEMVRAVVQTGSFSAAGRKLGKVQSAISMAIAGLEIDLGVTLFDRSTRLPTLTADGVELLRDMNRIWESAEKLTQKAELLSNAEPVTLHLSVFSLLPLQPVFRILENFRASFPDVTLNFSSVAAGDSIRMAGDQDQMALIFSPAADPIAANRALRQLGNLQLVAVAAPGHPLSEVRQQISKERLQPELQIIHADRDPSAMPDRGVHSSEVWRVSDLHVKHRMIRSGLGWGFMPVHMIQKEIRSGALKLLSSTLWGDHATIPVIATWPEDPPQGQSARWLTNKLMEAWREYLALEWKE